MKKITFMVIGILIVVGLVGAGTWAYFSDTETSGPNVFQAGTIDLTIGGTGATGVNFLNMQPGDTASGTFTVKNDGTLTGGLYSAAWYVQNDIVPYPTEEPMSTNKTADDVAKMLLVTTYTFDGADISASIPDPDGDSRTTLYDIVNDPTWGTIDVYSAGPSGGLGWCDWQTVAPGMTHTLVLGLQFDTDAGNDYQYDGITLTIEFLLTQEPSVFTQH